MFQSFGRCHLLYLAELHPVGIPLPKVGASSHLSFAVPHKPRSFDGFFPRGADKTQNTGKVEQGIQIKVMAHPKKVSRQRPVIRVEVMK